MATTKQKKKARRPRKATRLPKAVEALLNYLGPPTMGAPTIQQQGARFASLTGGPEQKGFATQVAEAVVARQAAVKASRLATGAEPLRKSLVSTIIPPQQPQSIIIQQAAAPPPPPAAAPAPSASQAEEIRKEVMKERQGIEGQLRTRLEWAQSDADLYKAIQETKAGQYDIGSLPSQPPSVLGRQSAPSFAYGRGITESGQGDIESFGGLTSAGSVDLPTVSASEVGAHQAAQYARNIATAELPPAQKLKGRAPKAAKEPKEKKPAGRPRKTPAAAAAAVPSPGTQSFSQAVGGLAAVAQSQAPRSISSAASAGSSKSRAREIYQTASRQGLSGGDIVYAMASGGAAAPEKQPTGISLGELPVAGRKESRTKKGMRVLGFTEV